MDVNSYYGGDNASLTVDELVTWADDRADDASSTSYVFAQRSKFTSISKSGSSPPQSRQYSISLSPTIIPSIGPLIDALISSGVSRYGGFKLLEKVAIYTGPGSVKPVPGSKEDVFKNKELSLLEKRRLMRFLMFAAGDFEGKKELEGKEDSPFVDFLRDVFSLDGQTAAAIAYALAFCISGTGKNVSALSFTPQSDGKQTRHCLPCSASEDIFARPDAMAPRPSLLATMVVSARSRRDFVAQPLLAARRTSLVTTSLPSRPVAIVQQIGSTRSSSRDWRRHLLATSSSRHPATPAPRSPVWSLTPPVITHRLPTTLWRGLWLS